MIEQLTVDVATGENLPAGHTKHCNDPGVGEYVPGGHAPEHVGTVRLETLPKYPVMIVIHVTPVVPETESPRAAIVIMTENSETETARIGKGSPTCWAQP